MAAKNQNTINERRFFVQQFINLCPSSERPFYRLSRILFVDERTVYRDSKMSVTSISERAKKEIMEFIEMYI